jgi:hypothetical protein
MSHVTCYTVPIAMCHMSHITLCHMSHITMWLTLLLQVMGEEECYRRSKQYEAPAN